MGRHWIGNRTEKAITLMIDSASSSTESAMMMTPQRSPLPLYHSHHRGRGNGILQRLLRRKKLVIVFLFVVVTYLASYTRSLLYNNNVLAAQNIAFKLQLSKQLPTEKELASLNKRLSRMTVDDVLKWAYKQFPPHQIVDVTSFGPSGLVLLHKLKSLGFLKTTPIVTIDTLHLFSATYHFIETLLHQQHELLLRDVSVQTYRPQDYSSSQQEFDDHYGKDFWKTDPEKYAYLSKVEPTLRALEETNALLWLTGRRRSQGGERSSLEILEIDTLMSNNYNDTPRYKLNPLAFWTYDQVWKYIHQHNIPYNPMHDQGYKSIGDFMTTAPVSHNASERSGRFVGLRTTECGIHATRAKIQRMKQQAESEGRDFDGITSLSCGTNCIEVTESTFDDVVLKSTVDILLEVYSPMCGACQEFAPKFESVAKQLEMYSKEIQIARFDITEQDVPESGQKVGLEVSVTPSLFLVKRDPFRIARYTGKLEATAVLKWIQNECNYIKLTI